LASVAVAALLVLPWLNPFTGGPNSAVVPYLLTWGCTSAALVCWAVLAQTDTQRLRTAALAWLVAACVSAALGLLQYFDISRDWAPWVNQPGMGQAFGNLRQRNQFATLCSMGLAALWWWAQQVPGQSRGRALGGWVLAALLGAASEASGSRTGFLQLVLLVVLGMWWGRRANLGHGTGASLASKASSGRWIGVVALLAYGLAALVLPRLVGADASVFDRLPLSNGGGDQCVGRVTIWRNMLYLIAQKPLWGWGWGELGYAHFITLYEAPWAGLRNCELINNAHNLPLHLAVELGLPVALLACATVILWIKQQRPWRELRPERQLAWAVLAVIGVHSLLEYPLWYGPFQVAALLCLWALRVFAAAPSAERATRWGAPAALAGAAIALACAGAGWNYWRASQPYLPPTERSAQFRGQSWLHLRDDWLFSEQVGFAQLAVTPVTPASAPYLLMLATDLLHFSPEPRVVQKLLQCAQMLGKEEEVAFYAQRFKAAYPAEYAQWAATSQGALQLP
jgi:O-antigen ligase